MAEKQRLLVVRRHLITGRTNTGARAAGPNGAGCAGSSAVTNSPAPTMSDFASLSYRELQAECKKQGLSAGGKTNDLIMRLTAARASAQETKAEEKPVGPTWSSLLQVSARSGRSAMFF